jgi:uncharacterized membrane protein
MQRWLGVCVAAWTCCASSAAPAGPHQVIFDLYEARTIHPAAINVFGDVAGSFQSGICGEGCGFIRHSNGTIENFQYPSSSWTTLIAINAAGSVVGDSSMGGFLRSPDGRFSIIWIPGTTFTTPYVIAADGTIAGAYGKKNGRTHGFLYANGTTTTFDPRPSRLTRPVAINGTDVVAGNFYDADNFVHGFVRQASGRIATFDAPGAGGGSGNGTFVTALDDAGTVVGYYTDNALQSHSFWRTPSGKITTFDPPGYSQSAAVGVAQNDKKPVIAGNVKDASGNLAYRRSRNGSVRMLKPSVIEVDAMGALGEIAGVYRKNPHAPPQGYLRIP